MADGIKIKIKEMKDEWDVEILYVHPIAQAVKKETEMKHKTGKEKHANRHITYILAFHLYFRMDLHSESTITMERMGWCEKQVNLWNVFFFFKKAPLCPLWGGREV